MRSFSILRLALIMVFCVCVHSACAQNTIVENPYVESSYISTYGKTSVDKIVFDGKYVYAYIQYRPFRGSSDISIAVSSMTTMTIDARSPQRIEGWEAVVDGKKIRLDLDVSYELWSTSTATFVLIFPCRKAPVSRMTISENVENGFYWRNILLKKKNQKRGDSKDGVAQEGGNAVPLHPEDPNGKDSPPDDFNRGGDLFQKRRGHFVVNASGSGFAVREDGIIATCYHVVEGARRIRIRGINNDFETPLYAEVVATDRSNDLAILRVKDPDFVKIQSVPYSIVSEVADVGESLIVLGYPLRAVMGDEIKLTSGLVSARSGFQGDTTKYQISAVVQSGNSGCPVFDCKGNVIGVVNARLMVEGAAYAIKGKYLNELLAKIDAESPLQKNNASSDRNITEIVKDVKSFVYIIEVE